MRILCVEDDRSSLALLVGMIEREIPDSHVVGVGSAEEALVMLERGPFDLVLTDMLLPGLSGLDLVDAAKRLPVPPEVIVITAHSSVDTAVDAMRRGAWDYLPKPLNAGLVRSRIECVAELLASRAAALDQAFDRELLESDALVTLRMLEREVAALRERVSAAADAAAAPGDPEDRLRAVLALLDPQTVCP